MNTTTAAEPAALIIPTVESALAKSELSQDGIASLREAYAPHFDGLAPLLAQARDVKPGQPKLAKAVRLALKELRCAGENTRTKLKSDVLLRGRAIDGMQHVLAYAISPVEAAMDDIEKAEERAEAKRKADLHTARAAVLAPYMDTAHMQLGEMTAEAYESLLAGAKAAKQAKADADAKEAAERAERERVAKEELAKRLEADRVERERLQAENSRLAKEAADRAAAQKLKDEAAEREKAAADKVAREERQRLAAKAEAEKRKAELAQAELDRIAREAEEKKKADAAAVRKAARAPDRAKVAEVGKAVAAIKVPKMATEEGQAVAALIQAQVEKFVAWIEKEGAKL